MASIWDDFDAPAPKRSRQSKTGSIWDDFDDTQGDIMRGVEVAARQTIPLFKGAVGLAGATAEKLVGLGGVATAIKDWGIRGYQEGMQRLEPLSRETDDVTIAWKRATDGDYGALIDWAQYAFGYGLAQVGETIGAAALGALMGPTGAVAGVVGRQGIKTGLSRLIEREVARRVGTGATEKAAVAGVARDIGALGSLNAYNLGTELGVTYGQGIEQAIKEGRELTGADLARIWGAGTIAGLSESATDALGLGAAMGRVPIPGAAGRVASAGIGALLGGSIEAGQELFQTLAERYGARQPLGDADAINDYINSAAMAFIPGAAVGGGIGAISRPAPAVTPVPTPSPAPATQPSIEPILEAPNVNEAVRAAAEAVSAPIPEPIPEQPAPPELTAGARTQEQLMADMALDAEATREARQKARDEDRLVRESRLPAAIGDVRRERSQRFKSGQAAFEAAPTAMMLAAERALAGKDVARMTDRELDLAYRLTRSDEKRTAITIEIERRKEIQRDQENQPRLPSQERIGEEPVQAEPVRGGGAEAVATGRVLQKQEQGPDPQRDEVAPPIPAGVIPPTAQAIEQPIPVREQITPPVVPLAPPVPVREQPIAPKKGIQIPNIPKKGIQIPKMGISAPAEIAPAPEPTLLPTPPPPTQPSPALTAPQPVSDFRSSVESLIRLKSEAKQTGIDIQPAIDRLKAVMAGTKAPKEVAGWLKAKARQVERVSPNIAQAMRAAQEALIQPAPTILGNPPATFTRKQLQLAASTGTEAVKQAARIELSRRDKNRKEGNPSLQFIRILIDMGGVNKSQALDIAGDKGVQNLGGVAARIFRTPQRNSSGQIVEGRGLDEVALRLVEEGWIPRQVYEESVDGGVQLVRDMIRDAIEGKLQPFTDRQVERDFEARAKALAEEEGAAEPTEADADMVDLVARANEIDATKLERLTIQYEGRSDAEFRAAVQEFVNANQRQDEGVDTGRQEAGSRAPRAEAAAEAAAPAPAAEEVTLTGQRPADLTPAAEQARVAEATQREERAIADREREAFGLTPPAGTTAAQPLAEPKNQQALFGAERRSEATTTRIEPIGQRDTATPSARELALRERSYDGGNQGDVLLDTGKYVSFFEAKNAARDAILAGEMRPVPAQLHFVLGIAARDWDRVLNAATSAVRLQNVGTSEQVPTPVQEPAASTKRGQEPKFVRAVPEEGPHLSVAETRAALQEAIDSVSVPVLIFDTVKDLRKEFGIAAPDDIKGVASGNRIGIVAAQTRDALDAQKTFWHEAFHVGLGRVIPRASQEYEIELERIADNNPNVLREAAEWRRLFGRNQTDMLGVRGWPANDIPRMVRLISFEEALAQLSSENATINGIERFIAALQKIIRAMGLNELANFANWMEGKTNAEALSLIKRARESITGTSETHILTAENAPAYIKEPRLLRGPSPAEQSRQERESQIVEIQRIKDESREQAILDYERGERVIEGEIQELPLFSRGEIADTILERAPIRVQDFLRSDRKLNRLISKINTPFHISEVMRDMRTGRLTFKPVYNLGQAFYQDFSRLALSAADLAPALLPRIEQFRNVLPAWMGGPKSPAKTDIEAISRALYAGTLYGGGNPLEGVIWSGDELKGKEKTGRPIPKSLKDNPLNDQQIKLYRQALASIGFSLEEHAKALVWRMARNLDITLDKEMSLQDIAQTAKDQANAKIEDLRQQVEALDITETEGAAKRIESLRNKIKDFEAFKTEVNDLTSKTEGLKRHGYFPAMRFGEYFVYVERTDKTGKHEQLHFSLHESQQDANKTAREMEQRYPDAEVTHGLMNKEAHKLFAGLDLPALEVFAEHIQKAMGESVDIDPIMQAYFRMAAHERSIYAREIHRKGVPGYSDDVPRVLASFTVTSARAASSVYHTADMLRAVQDIEDGDLQAYATRYIRYLQDPQEESPRLRSFLANYYILGSAAFGAVNLTQPITVTIPRLVQFVSYDQAVKIVSRAAFDVVKGHQSLLGAEREMFERAIREGHVAPQELHQIRAESQASMFGKNLGWRKAMHVWGSIFSLTEQFNRGTSFLAGYRLAVDQGMDDPYEFAKTLVAETQFTYNRANRPELSRGSGPLGPAGPVILTFKQFTISYVELATRLYRADKVAFAFMMLTLFALAGLEGLPFAEDAEDLIDAIGQKLGYATNTQKTLRRMVTEILGPTIGDILLHGASAIPGTPIDVANRLGMHNLIPGTAMFKTSDPDKVRDIVQILGPAASIVDRVVLKGDMKALLPKAFQDVAKAGDMALTGMYRDYRKRKIMDTTPADAFFKAIGFQPAKLAREQRIINENQQDIALHKVIEDAIALQWAQGIFEKDREKVNEAREQLREWNATNKDLPIRITSQQIIRRVREMQKTREARFVKSAPPEIRRAVRGEMRSAAQP